ncbi:hypothetical protein DL766_004192 [Monosporascus sp. MC13-8B]|uniref:RNA polymerase II transcription factor B subunit 3 n=1 Tax=Monosporascus cannonballus TaxID=155416 RepID=A0ABY0HJW6_9PEZI|nr:hypothetical protein DL762_000211 [Monosporascus cannonballus]RYP01482.1 hypothetical protein DL763_000145 [Monosporascus cannonballus]RYP31907.1 hypothetical protein DL766_004192 [Monosporascus sp. MC13-8B]
MSRKPATAIRPTTTGTAPSSTASILPSEICPVCKRVRYLNTDMEFLINPECYHAMCSNCVSNIFKSGPAQCPYASCAKTLRFRGFRSAFFGDLSVEREVDVRRRVAAVFNMAQDDFETLRDYNNYLQEVEDLTFDLVSGGEAERARAEERLRAHEQAHRDEIERNKRRGREAEALRRRRDAEEAEAALRRRREEREQEERARAEEAKIRDEVMEALARGGDGSGGGASAAEIRDRIVADKRARLAKIAGSHFKSALDSAAPLSSSLTAAPPPPASVSADNSAGTGNLLFSIRGLKDKAKLAADEEEDLARPYDPFGGLDLTPTRYRLAGADGDGDGDGYENPWLADARARDDHRVPGYDTAEYVARAMFEAFAGLGISVADEKADAQRAGVGTAGAEVAAARNQTSGARGGLGSSAGPDVFV